MMIQYLEIKEQYKDFILFFRLGDFYEMFFDVAGTVSRELGLTLTGRDCGEGRAPMCGVPYHACEEPIGKLISLGYKVAICEQTEDPSKAQGLVRREIVRVVTPGTLIESELLDGETNNYLCTICRDESGIGISFTDISTAYMTATGIDSDPDGSLVTSELSTFVPREIILNFDPAELPALKAYIDKRGDSVLVEPDRRLYSLDEMMDEATKRVTIPDGTPSCIVRAAGCAFYYLKVTQLREPDSIRELSLYSSAQYLEMDTSTRRNLELCETMLTKDKKGSLLWVLDKTKTAAGARMLRYRIEHPLTNVTAIKERLRTVEALLDNFILREEIGEKLSSVLDLERLITRVTYKTAGARELRAICQTASVLPDVKAMLLSSDSSELVRLGQKLDTLEDLYSLIDASIVEAPPFQVREGGIIRDGYDAGVDELRSIINDSKSWLERIADEERERTGIKNMKIGYNRVFGYYIDVPRRESDNVPEDYVRKQTLSTSERYITEKLKEAESTILGASEKIKSLEYELFSAVRDTVAENEIRVRSTASALAELDFFLSLATVAAAGGYVCPEVNDGDAINIVDGRHPVVERFTGDSYFVPNSCRLDRRDNRLLLITGPNMAGKSTYMRQTALIVLMAQIGSFVPAASASIGIVDKLFTRVGASDDLAAGESTFMVEMREVSYILKHATPKSFIIYDEIGRGTGTYDGMSIARAVAEYTAGRSLGAKAMFATHYRELASLEGEIDGVVNCSVAAKKRGDELTFLRRIVPGPADDSYGIEVAKLAGVPDKVIKRAKEVLAVLESGAPAEVMPKKIQPAETPAESQFSLTDMSVDKIKDELSRLDVNSMTPIEAMNKICEWKDSLGKL